MSLTGENNKNKPVNEHSESPMNSSKEPAKTSNQEDDDYLYQNAPEKIGDYIILKDLGQGTFGLVYLVEKNGEKNEKKENNENNEKNEKKGDEKNEKKKKKYALKIINKHFLSLTGKGEEALIERIILTQCKHPSIIKLSQAFQKKNKLYFVIEYCPNKDLDNLIKKLGTFDNDLALQIIAELVNVMDYLHNKMEISHNDIKPSNILLDENYHIKLCDFSTCKVKGKVFDKKKGAFVDSDESISKDIFGTAQFISPEMVNQTITDYRTNDVWSLGIIIYMIFNGESPFKGDNDFLTIENVKKCKYEYIKKDIPEDVKDLLNHILIEDTKQRFNITEIKKHKYFKDINWETLLTNKVPIDEEKLKELDKKNIENNSNENFWEAFCDNINNNKDSEKDIFDSDKDFLVEKLVDYPPKINKDFFYSNQKVEELQKSPDYAIVGVLKKCGFIEKEVKFKLFKNNKTLEIIELNKNDIIKKIELDKKTKINRENEYEFIFNGDKYRTSPKEVDKWNNNINEVINEN